MFRIVLMLLFIQAIFLFSEIRTSKFIESISKENDLQSIYFFLSI